MSKKDLQTNNFSVINPLNWIEILDPPPSDEQIQPNGIDLRVNRIYTHKTDYGSEHFFGKNSKNGYPLVEYKPIYDSILNGYYWKLNPNSEYVIEYLEAVKIPKNTMGLIFPRSSLWRLFGALIHTSVWDSGYVGVG
ncbi:MAG: dCTP deaminase domain-containing protein, partial [Candidatus Odinarchaeia archaeon]